MMQGYSEKGRDLGKTERTLFVSCKQSTLFVWPGLYGTTEHKFLTHLGKHRRYCPLGQPMASEVLVLEFTHRVQRTQVVREATKTHSIAVVLIDAKLPLDVCADKYLTL